MKYGIILKNKINLIAADEEFFNNNDNVIEFPDEVNTGWEINDDGNVIKPAMYVSVVDIHGDKVENADKIKISDEEIIVIN